MFVFLSVYMGLILLIGSYNCFHADTDLCNDFVLNSAVYTDDGYTYIFKGIYFWQTNQLNINTGIISNARKTSEKWPQLKEPITASFTVQYTALNKSLTIFLINDKWYGYQNGEFKKSGSTSKWPLFPHSRVSAAFPSNYINEHVYVLYNKNNLYILYDLTNINKPKYMRMGRTTVNKNKVWFLDQGSLGSNLVITDVLDLKAVITYKDWLLFIAPNHYCLVDLNQKKWEKKCLPISYENSNLFNCPIAIAQNPTTLVTTIRETDAQFPNSSYTSKHHDKTTNTGISSSEPINEPIDERKQVSSKSLSPAIIAIIIIVVIVLCVVIVGAFGFAYKRRKSSKKKRHKNGRNELTSESLTTIDSVKTIDSDSGNPIKDKNNKTN